MVLADTITITNPTDAGRSITYTLDAQYEVGVFVDGSPWAVENTPGGGVGIVSVSHFTVDGSRHRSGTMLNPSPTAGNGRDQGYDSAMYGSSAAQYWKPALCQNLLLPRTYPAGSSLVSTVSKEAAGSLSQLDFAGVLTILAAIPAADAFRPPYCAAPAGVKVPQWTAADLDLDSLPSLFSWSTLMEPTRSLASTLAGISGFWLDHARGWLHRYMAPEDVQPNYGREMTAELGNALLGLISDLSTAQKRELAIAIVQKGIDNFYLLDNGHAWPADGGHMAGRKAPILIAGQLLGHAGMLGIGAAYTSAVRPSGLDSFFGEDGQTFIVEETSPGVVNYGQGGYGPADVGTPEWGFRHYENPGQDDRVWGADSYRRCCTANTWGAEALTIMALGLRDEWSHEPLFLYLDRFMDTMPVDPQTAAVYPAWQRSYYGAHGNVWDLIRDTVGAGGEDFGLVNAQNESIFARDFMGRTTQPALQGQLPDTNAKIVTDAGEWVAWEPYQTENGEPRRWPDGSYMYASCWIPGRLGTGQTMPIALSIDPSAAEPTFELHPAVAAQLGTWLDGGTATGWQWRCNVAPNTPRANPRSIFTHGTLETIYANANVRRVKWTVRSADNRWLWVHYFEFYRGVPYARFQSNPVFQLDTTPDLTDYLENGVDISSTGCFPVIIDSPRFTNPNGGSFASWSRNWGGNGPVGDAQGPGSAQGILVFLDPANPGSASQDDIDTARACLEIEETVVSSRWPETGSFGPYGHIPALPARFSTPVAAFNASVTQARNELAALNNLPFAHPNRYGVIPSVMSQIDPAGPGTQSDHGVSKHHQITVLGVPTWLPLLQAAVGREWSRPIWKYESGAVAGTSDGDIVSVANHPNLAIWDCRPFTGDLLGKGGPIFSDHIRQSSNPRVNLANVVTRTASAAVPAYSHNRIIGGVGVQITLPEQLAWVIVDNETGEDVDVVPSGTRTIAGSAGFVVPAYTAILFTLNAPGGVLETDWLVDDGYQRAKGYDRQHFSINFVTHYALLSSDPLAGHMVDHFRELLRGTMRDFAYVQGGGNFTIGSFEADRQVGRCSLAAAWIESLSPQPAFRAAIDSYFDTSLSAGLASTPQEGAFGQQLAASGFSFLDDLLAPGHELRGLEIDNSSIIADWNNVSTTVRSFTPWQRGIMMAGMWAWHRMSGNARALDLCKILGYNAIEYLWWEDTQAVPAGGYWSTFHALRFDHPGSIGNLPPANLLPPLAPVVNLAGGYGADLGNGIAAFRKWTGFQEWTWPCFLIARQMMILDGNTSGDLWDKVNAIARGQLQQHYAPFPAVSGDVWNGPSDNDLDWSTVVPNPYATDYGETPEPEREPNIFLRLIGSF